MSKDFTIYYDPRIEETHISEHNVSIEEITDFFENKKFVFWKRRDKSYVAFGKTSIERYLKIVYRKMSVYEYFIITAYDIIDQEEIEIIEELYESN
ncbi:MAG: hypothetical protein L6Q54_15400 [Leptospiraceae bacterium]|nr:hypothetical protein [Leptospiraceae bacterium]MCK6382620.1 hypothetical protein [Leptospiraceae bacterium]